MYCKNNKSTVEYDDAYSYVDSLLTERNVQYSTNCTYILNDNDYIKCGLSMGKSSGYGIAANDNSECYAVIHSNDIEMTEKFLEQIFEGILIGG